jgi:hypothetical protein
MPAGAPPWVQTLPFVIPLVIFGVLMLRRMRPRPLNVSMLWVSPLILSAVMVLPFIATPPSTDALSIAILAISLVLGCVLGWYRGRLTTITVDPRSHVVTAQVSPFGSMLLLAVFLVRYFGRGFLMQNAASWHISPFTLTDAFLLFAWGLVVVQRGEMWVRSRRLVGEAKTSAAGEEAGPPGPPPLVQ